MKFLHQKKCGLNEKAFNESDYEVLSYEELLKVNGEEEVQVLLLALVVALLQVQVIVHHQVLVAQVHHLAPTVVQGKEGQVVDNQHHLQVVAQQLLQVQLVDLHQTAYQLLQEPYYLVHQA